MWWEVVVEVVVVGGGGGEGRWRQGAGGGRWGGQGGWRWWAWRSGSLLYSLLPPIFCIFGPLAFLWTSITQLCTAALHFCLLFPQLLSSVSLAFLYALPLHTHLHGGQTGMPGMPVSLLSFLPASFPTQLAASLAFLKPTPMARLPA